MSIAIEQSKPLGLAIYEILREAQASEKSEGRGATRYSFFRPITLFVGKERHTGFSREVSETGIGLMHTIELSPGEVEVVIPTQQRYSVRIRTRIIWCKPCGEGWYISGGEFLGIAGIGD
jgi:hypothetical protein